MKDYIRYTDEALLEMLKNGDEDVMDFLIDKYKAMVRKKARVLYLTGGDQDDLIQEGMIGLFKAVRDYQADRDTSFATFAQLCVDRQLYHAIQSSNRQKHRPLNGYVSLSTDEWESQFLHEFQPSPENIVIAQENALHMREQIGRQLSPMENQVLQLYLDGKDYLEIAEELEKSPKSIDNALQRVRNKVREYIEKQQKK